MLMSYKITTIAELVQRLEEDLEKKTKRLKKLSCKSSTLEAYKWPIKSSGREACMEKQGTQNTKGAGR